MKKEKKPVVLRLESVEGTAWLDAKQLFDDKQRKARQRYRKCRAKRISYMTRLGMHSKA